MTERECDYRGIADEVVSRGISLAESYEDWTRLAMSLAQLGEDGREIFHLLSAVSPKYREAECERKWRNAAARSDRSTPAVFVWMAKQAGVDVSPYYHSADDGRQTTRKEASPVRRVKPQPRQIYYIEYEYYSQFVSYNSVFVESLFYFATDEQIEGAVELYQLGADEKRRVIFPRIVLDGRLLDAKIMGYTLDCRRIKGDVTWLIYGLKRQGLIPMEYQPPRTLFGLHLIIMEEFRGKPCVIVESCKSAVVGSMFLPDFAWMATGGVEGDFTLMLRPLAKRGRKIVLIPDGGKYETWCGKAARAADAFKGEGLKPDITVSRMVEDNATESDIQSGIDVADWIITDRRNFTPAEPETDDDRRLREMCGSNPTLAAMVGINHKLGELIKAYGLELEQ